MNSNSYNLKSFFFLLKNFIYLFLERGKGREKERERNINRLPLACPLLGTRPTTQACARTRNQTGKLPVLRPALNPLSHTSQGQSGNFKWTYILFSPAVSLPGIYSTDIALPVQNIHTIIFTVTFL